jgi:hypothetical protein
MPSSRPGYCADRVADLAVPLDQALLDHHHGLGGDGDVAVVAEDVQP